MAVGWWCNGRAHVGIIGPLRRLGRPRAIPATLSPRIAQTDEPCAALRLLHVKDRIESLEQQLVRDVRPQRLRTHARCGGVASAVLGSSSKPGALHARRGAAVAPRGSSADS
eukprot:4613114-Prymnesium_polylepis.2